MSKHFNEASKEQLREYQARAMETRRERYRLKRAFAQQVFAERQNIHDVMERLEVSQSAAYRMIDIKQGKE
jgi:hypothetical protein